MESINYDYLKDLPEPVSISVLWGFRLVNSENAWRAFGFKDGRPKHGRLINKLFRNKHKVAIENWLYRELVRIGVAYYARTLPDEDKLRLYNVWYDEISNYVIRPELFDYEKNEPDFSSKLCGPIWGMIQSEKVYVAVMDDYIREFGTNDKEMSARIQIGVTIVDHFFEELVPEYTNFNGMEKIPKSDFFDLMMGDAISDIKNFFDSQRKGK